MYVYMQVCIYVCLTLMLRPLQSNKFQFYLVSEAAKHPCHHCRKSANGTAAATKATAMEAAATAAYSSVNAGAPHL